MALKRKHVDFIMNLRRQGKTFPQIAESFGKKFGEQKSTSAVESAYRRYEAEYDFESPKSTVEVKSDLMRERILADFIKMVGQRKYVPTSKEFHIHSNFNRDSVNRYFGAFDGLVQTARQNDPDTFENLIDESSFTDEAFEQLRDYVADHKVIVITSAVTGRKPFELGLKSVENYVKSRDAALLILPCSDPAAQKDRKDKWSLSPRFDKSNIVFRDLPLNDKITVSAIQMSAKQLQPLTGLKRLAKNRGTVIVAATKQFLEYNANSNKKDIPRGLISTGAITENNYESGMYMSQRLSYLAEQDHKFGGVIIEIENGKTFHMRNFTIDPKTGTFCDIDKKYYPSGKIENVTAELVQIPDYHVGSECKQAEEVARQIVEAVKPDYLTIEDFFDGISINPHEANNLVSQSRKSREGLTLEKELKACRDKLDQLCGWAAKQIVWKYGNHEDFLPRYIKAGTFMKEPQNKILAMEINVAMEKHGKAAVEHAMRVLFPIKYPEKVKFLTINDSFVVNGIENGVHGHLGKGGRRNPGMSELEDCYGRGNFGHNHSASIFRDVYRVGTLTEMQLGYNDGPGSWTNTILIQHRDGSRQLINSIYGKWRLGSKK